MITIALVIVAFILAILDAVKVATQFPLLAIAVMLICIAMLIPAAVNRAP